MNKQTKKHCVNNHCEHCKCDENAPEEVKEIQKRFYIDVPKETNSESIKKFKKEWNPDHLIEPMKEVSDRHSKSFYEGFKSAIDMLKKDCDRDRHGEAIVLLETELSYWNQE